MPVPDTPENLGKCICGDCPTYNDCMLGGSEGLYCGRGQTGCDLTRRGCICDECPVRGEYGLRRMYFCVVGAE